MPLPATNKTATATERFFTKKNTLLIVSVITLWKVYLAATLQLHPDEAYYWLWSRFLDLSYYDHPPLVAYCIRAATLVSQAEFWVRLPSIAGGVVVSVLAWLLAKEISGRTTVAAASVLMLNSLPLTISSLIITPDTPAFLFWALAVYTLWRIVATGRPALWYLFGLSFGLGLLSKYTLILLAPCVFLFMLATDEKKWFKTPHPYLAFLFGMAMFLPVVIWNSRHEWVSFGFQLGHGLGGQDYSIGRLFEYIGGQMLVAGPLAWIAGMTASMIFLVSKDKKKLFLCLTSLPVLAFFAYSSLKRSAGPNWPASAYFSFSILLSLYLIDSTRSKRIVWISAFIVNIVFSLVATAHTRFSIIPIASFSEKLAMTDATNSFYGWKELAASVEKDPATTFTLMTSPQITAEISYYTRQSIAAYVDLPNAKLSQFDFWGFPESMNPADGAYITATRDTTGEERDEFLSRSPKNEYVPVTRKGFLIRSYLISREIPPEGPDEPDPTTLFN